MKMMRKEIEGNVKYEEWKEYEAELEKKKLELKPKKKDWT